VGRCKSNHLQLNTSKTKEMMVDRRKRPHLQPIPIEGSDVEVVRTYKYLGLQLDDKLDWTVNTESMHLKRTESSLLPEKAGVL